MSRSMMLSVFAVAATAMTANAADLPARSRLGAIFAEPEEVRVEVYQSVEYPAPIIGFNLLPDPPWARSRVCRSESARPSASLPGPRHGPRPRESLPTVDSVIGLR